MNLRFFLAFLGGTGLLFTRLNVEQMQHGAGKVQKRVSPTDTAPQNRAKPCD